MRKFPLHHWLRRLRRAMWYLLVGGLVVVALCVALASQLLPLVERHPDKVAGWLGERIGRPVVFEHLHTRWTRRGPLLQVDGLSIGAVPGSGGQPVRIGRAEVLVSMYAGLLPGRSFTELRLRGLALTARRGEDGQWHVQGLPGQAPSAGDPLDALQGLGELQVVDGSLRLLAPALGWDVRVPQIDLRLQVEQEKARLGLRLRGRAGGKPLLVSALLMRHTGVARAWIHGHDLELVDWSPLAALAGTGLRAGRGDVQAWLALQGGQVDSVAAMVDLAGVVAAPASDPASPVVLDQVQARALLRRQGDGWRLQVPALHSGAAGTAGLVEDLVAQTGARPALSARRIQSGPLLQALAASDRVPAGLRAWLRGARPEARLSQVQAQTRHDGQLSFQARLDGVSFRPVGTAPGLSGLGGQLQGDGDGVVLALDPAAPFDFDWPAGFGVHHPAALHGSVAAWREQGGIRVATPSLVVDGRDFGVDARGGMTFFSGGRAPLMDLAATVHDSPVVAAKGFLVRHLMPPPAQHWLDMALQGGTLAEGRGLVSGDLADWPFTRHDGVFIATGHLRDARIRFQPDWPEARRLDALAVFTGSGFTVDGSAELDGVPVRQVHAAIDHYSHGQLAVDAAVDADAAHLLAMLRHSPLQASFGKPLQNLRLDGPARGDFALRLPLDDDPGTQVTVDGHVDLEDVRLEDPDWKLAFQQVRGRLHYTQDALEAPALVVHHDGQPGQLALRAAAAVHDPAQVFEAQLQAAMTPQELLAQVPQLAWLGDYLHGRSQWNVGVQVGQPQGGDAPVQVSLHSDMAGTAMDLPAPLDKPAAQALQTSVVVAMPPHQAPLQVDVAFDHVVALRARQHGDDLGVRVEAGRASVQQAPPVRGISVGGTADRVDALGWITLARAAGSAPASAPMVKAAAAAATLPGANPRMAQAASAAPAGASPLPLAGIDVTAQRLLLAGGGFADTRLQVASVAGGLQVRADGQALAGTVSIPDAEGAPVSGQFARLYWTPAPAVAGQAPATPADATPQRGAGIDPASLPLLSLRVDDLHLDQAQLGQAVLKTRHVAGGLAIDQLQTRAPKQRIDVTGDWTGTGAGARTAIQLTLQSQDGGALLSGLGFGGQLRGGEGTLDLDVRWPGGPSDFALANLQGQMRVDSRNGALLEVEPGAGRVLGLLSIAQLPRRMMLDFRDFFSKGFTYNKVAGQVAFGNGQARTDDLTITGPAAQIHIAGSADLRNQLYDQTIHVEPHAGNLLTVVGAVTGGPVGAAIGAAANAVLSKPLGQIGAKTYHVTGPWKDPKVDVAEHDDAEAGGPAPATPPAQGPAPPADAPTAPADAPPPAP